MTTEHCWRLRCNHCEAVYHEVAETQAEVRERAQRNGWTRVMVLIDINGYLCDLCPKCTEIAPSLQQG